LLSCPLTNPIRLLTENNPIPIKRLFLLSFHNLAFLIISAMPAYPMGGFGLMAVGA